MKKDSTVAIPHRVRLGVNIDHVATIRNARGGAHPSPLVAALQDRRLGAAGLDVFTNEPHVPAALFDMPNVILTPHIGSATVETRRAMGNLVVDNLLQHLADGRVISPVPECVDLAMVVDSLDA